MSLSIVDWFKASSAEIPIGIYGSGEGGMLALFAGGLDTRIRVTCVSGFFGPRDGSWQEPIDRNFAGLLRDLGVTGIGDAGRTTTTGCGAHRFRPDDNREQWWGTV